MGFGTLAGLLARVVLPVQEPRGMLLTMALGIVGSTIGLLLLSLLFRDGQFNPLSPLGFLAATVSAFVLLIVYRIVYVCIPKEKKDAEG